MHIFFFFFAENIVYEQMPRASESDCDISHCSHQWAREGYWGAFLVSVVWFYIHILHFCDFNHTVKHNLIYAYASKKIP